MVKISKCIIIFSTTYLYYSVIPHYVVAKVLDCDNVVNEFEIQLRDYIIILSD